MSIARDGEGRERSTGPDDEALVGQLEGDLKRLLREAAEARFQLAEAARQRAAAERAGLVRLVEVQDAFERVFRSVEAKPDKVTEPMKVWLGNFRAVSRLLDRHLADLGVLRLPPAAGQAFDPARHTILETLEDEAREPGTVAEEVQPGWERGGEVLRKASVRVVRGHGEDDAWEG